MNTCTKNIYQLKRKILNFADKLSVKCTKPYKKFTADMLYGILKSQSCLLSAISDTLKEPIKKKNSIERLSLHLARSCPNKIKNQFLKTVSKWCSDNPVVYIDDSDVIKPYGKKFEALGTVRDGSSKDKSFENGYHVTEAVCLTRNKAQPVSLFSRVHSSLEEDYTSNNTITLEAINNVTKLLKPDPTFVMDRGYNQNMLFDLFDKNKQNYVIRVKTNRKFCHENKWIPGEEMVKKEKGNVSFKARYKGKYYKAYLSYLKVNITAHKNPVYLIIVHSVSDTPMMLLTNIEIKGKEDLIKVAKLYFSRWRIEEYFRAKKQLFLFENFRVRSLKAINHLNMCITFCLAFLARMSDITNNYLHHIILKSANSLKKKVLFYFYRISKGISNILDYAHTGVKAWYT